METNSTHRFTGFGLTNILGTLGVSSESDAQPVFLPAPEYHAEVLRLTSQEPLEGLYYVNEPGVTVTKI